MSASQNNYMTAKERFDAKKKSEKQVQRAQIINNIYSENIQKQVEKFGKIISGKDQYIDKEEGLVLKAEEIYPEG